MKNKRALTVNALRRAGFVGSDACLATSLFEYGLAWKVYKRASKSKGAKAGDILFYYGIAVKGNDYSAFDYAWLAVNTSVQMEYEWALDDSFYKSNGIDRDEWLTLSLPVQIRDLLGYYGSEEIFGSSYYEGFVIKE